MTSKTISDQISKFLLKLQSSKDASEHTIRAYEADLRHWARFIECSKKVSSIKELEKQIHPSWFRDYFSYIKILYQNLIFFVFTTQKPDFFL